MSYILIVIFFLAIFAKFFMFFNKKNFSKEKYCNIVQRINTWFIIIFIVFIASLNKITMLILFSIISFLACREFFSLYEKRLNSKLNFFIVTNILIFYISIYYRSLVIFVLSLIFSFLIALCSKEIKIFLCSFIINIYMLGAINTITDIKLIISLLVLIEANDVFQYIVGNLYGRYKISPKISPNKTLEGLLGGIILTTIFSIFIKIFFEKNLILTIAPLISLLGFLGDIFISYFKRKFNRKDSGTLLKGHGGILDRVDSLIFNSIFLALIYNLTL